MKMRVVLKWVFLIPVLLNQQLCLATGNDFSKYPVALYQGEMHVPAYYKKTSDGWRVGGA